MIFCESLVDPNIALLNHANVISYPLITLNTTAPKPFINHSRLGYKWSISKGAEKT